jgi:hypothetical protein
MQIEDYGECFREETCGRFWFLHGQLHREDGPAEMYSNGHKRWYIHGKAHREDGPAVIYVHGSKSWYLNGKRISREEWKMRVKCL